VHEQIESFLETVMGGMMGPHDQGFGVYPIVPKE
jgi:hypothetical protein